MWVEEVAKEFQKMDFPDLWKMDYFPQGPSQLVSVSLGPSQGVDAATGWQPCAERLSSSDFQRTQRGQNTEGAEDLSFRFSL